MNTFHIVVPTLFGLESITAKEIKHLGYDEVTVEDGRVTFKGDIHAVIKANLWLRTGERVLIKVGEFEATTFDSLFEQTKALPWHEWLDKDCAFPVKGYSLKSGLFSVPDCQAIIKKAIVEKLKQKYSLSWFEEKGALYSIQFSLYKDKVTLMIDTSGEGLHKRGYREQANLAPLRETLAAAMIQLSYWRHNRPFADPFCGSGTICIEAALIGKNIAPGLERNFSAEKFTQIPKKLWWDARNEAHAQMKDDLELAIFASDNDPKSIALITQNAELAGVEDCIHIEEKAVKDFKMDTPYGTLICNPPYGERMGERKEVEMLYREMGRAFHVLPQWSSYIITAHEQFELFFGKKASKKRKMYNGMLKCDFYQYFGPKPPRE